jgi:hypothetical protein
VNGSAGVTISSASTVWLASARAGHRGHASFTTSLLVHLRGDTILNLLTCVLVSGIFWFFIKSS